MCMKCLSDFYWHEEQKACVDNCGTSFFKYNDGGIAKCFDCSSNCEVCDNSKSCLKCKGGFYWHEGFISCVDDCGNMYYGFNDNGLVKCLKCSSNCDQCQNSEFCLQCKAGFYWHEESKLCVDDCGVTFYKSDTDGIGICKHCMKNCDQCQNSEFCLKCKAGFYWHEESKLCVDDCGKLLYEFNDNGVGKCLNCSKNCEVCNREHECLICTDNFFLRKDKYCYDNCPSKFFKNSLNRTCDDCFQFCLICSNAQTCISCEFPYFLNEQIDRSTCVLDCPLGYYGDVSTRKCDLLINLCINRNPCLNAGKCSVLENKIVCECPVEYIGNRCKRKVPLEIPKPPIEEPAKPPKDPEELTEFTKNKIDDMINGNVPPDPKILDVAKEAIENKITTIVSSNFTNVNLKEIESKVDSMKNSINSLAAVLLKSSNITQPKIHSTDLFSVHISTTDKSNKNITQKLSREKNLTIIESDACEEAMKNF